MESLKVVGEVLVLIVKLIYFWLESVYRIFVPVAEVSVKGEIVLITGAGHGIGKELALQYASLGAIVVAWDINEGTNKATVAEIKKHGGKAHHYKCDVTNRAEVNTIVQKVHQEVGEITIIINNAGIMPTKKLLDHKPEEIELMFNLNVMSHFWIIQAILPSMLKNKHGHIVSISSAAGLVGCENIVPYCAAKFAVYGMLDALRMELKDYPGCNVYTTTVCPFMVDTGLCEKPNIRFPSIMELLKPKDVALAIVDAQRRNKRLLVLPGTLNAMMNVFRNVPDKSTEALRRFAYTRLEAC